ncbi:MAG: deoxyribodipyrimidine photo-lyase, partial [Rhodospirillales bacterium]
MSIAPPILVWFRRDLRLADNPALARAAALRRPVVPVFILDEGMPGP